MVPSWPRAARALPGDARGRLLAMSIRSYLRMTQRSTVIVQNVSGTSLKGVLVGAYRDGIVLTHASAAPTGTKDFVAVDGEQFVPHKNVDWIQVTEAAT
jgi:hypothetical protein